MSRRFVIEAVLVAVYGELMAPSRPVEYLIPYSTILELYEMKDSPEPVMPDTEDDAHVKGKIVELIAFFDDSFNKKKLERALVAPWRPSPPLPINENVTFTVINAVDNAQYGESFDPIETEVVLTSLREKAPILTDQLELMEKIIQAEVPVQVYDVYDFEFAVEDGITADDLMKP
ncbi:ADP-heptose synthase [Paenibacillus sp. MZ04-78.2]|uniref:ADP-heptose synthase n=1 Tax=Paenibacillus sp. MZ04-78.2 TaxID=2962034 RepID=UPI0020B6A03F|nr:ADP-heptose synthase [Paenibacillus sp. MZ04-78.2]MCP3772916.1 ADP-heptose synthase [Paenibacillus sp. MZ04-78.2]